MSDREIKLLTDADVQRFILDGFLVLGLDEFGAGFHANVYRARPGVPATERPERRDRRRHAGAARVARQRHGARRPPGSISPTGCPIAPLHDRGRANAQAFERLCASDPILAAVAPAGRCSPG